MDTALYIIGFFGFAYLGSLLMDLFLTKISVKSVLHLLGAEYIFLGILIGPNVLKIIDVNIINQLKPFIGLGIGWVGLLFGSQLNFSDLKKFPSVNLKLSFVQGIGAFIFVLISLLALIIWKGKVLHISTIQPWFILAAISISTSPIVIGYLTKRIRSKEKLSSLIYFISSTDGAWSIILFGIACALVMTKKGSLSLVGYDLFWSFISIAIGVILGYLFRMLLRFKYSYNEFLLIIIGFVTLSSGCASFLGLSPLLINFIIGIIVANTHEKKTLILEVLVVYEKIFYIIFLVMAGCLWEYPGREVILVAGIYIFARAIGKWFGFLSGYLLLKKKPLDNFSLNLGWAFLPQAGLAIAMAIDYKGNFPGKEANIILSTILASVVISHLLSPSIIKPLIRKDR